MDLKAVGYLLLIAGLLMIILSTIRMYQVYSGQTAPYKLFNQNSITVNLKDLLGSGQNPLDRGSAAGNSTMELFSAQTINSSLNLVFELVLMTFIAGSGFKIASLGVQLLRPVNIKSSILS